MADAAHRHLQPSTRRPETFTTEPWTATPPAPSPSPSPSARRPATVLRLPLADDDPPGTPSDTSTVTITVSDDDTGSTAAPTTVTVNNVAPTASVTGPSPVDEGSTEEPTTSPSPTRAPRRPSRSTPPTRGAVPAAPTCRARSRPMRAAAASSATSRTGRRRTNVSIKVTDDDGGSETPAPRESRSSPASRNVDPVVDSDRPQARLPRGLDPHLQLHDDRLRAARRRSARDAQTATRGARSSRDDTFNPPVDGAGSFDCRLRRRPEKLAQPQGATTVPPATAVSPTRLGRSHGQQRRPGRRPDRPQPGQRGLDPHLQLHDQRSRRRWGLRPRRTGLRQIRRHAPGRDPSARQPAPAASTESYGSTASIELRHNPRCHRLRRRTAAGSRLDGRHGRQRRSDRHPDVVLSLGQRLLDRHLQLHDQRSRRRGLRPRDAQDCAIGGTLPSGATLSARQPAPAASTAATPTARARTTFQRGPSPTATCGSDSELPDGRHGRQTSIPTRHPYWCKPRSTRARPHTYSYTTTDPGSPETLRARDAQKAMRTAARSRGETLQPGRRQLAASSAGDAYGPEPRTTLERGPSPTATAARTATPGSR